MDFSIQPLLKNEMAEILPLRADHFDLVYQAASDPQVWEQHPNRNRYQKEVFKVYFEGAIESKGAFMIKDILTGEIAGCTRFYNYDPEKKMILIGYTFYAKKYWGTGLNHAVKKSMLDYIFQYVDHVHFHIGACNVRSQISIGRLRAHKIGEEVVRYYGEAPASNFIYEISKKDWLKHG